MSGAFQEMRDCFDAAAEIALVAAWIASHRDTEAQR
jgi:hypothetical protein